MKSPTISISHIGLRVADMKMMKDFYARVFGFTVTDEEEGRMVFFSGDPSDHHQLFMVPRENPDATETRLAHVAFRVPDLDALRVIGDRLMSEPGVTNLNEVTHGNAWSLYFNDPEGNRAEVLVDTPWHVAQPFRRPAKILSVSDEELAAWTDSMLDEQPTKRPMEEWRADIAKKMTSDR